ncbi:MAG: peptidase M75, Imelysin [Rhizobiaceae bacterium]|nr:peptidase M75, Imelysin [Rhizobiaceae bacterium]
MKTLATTLAILGCSIVAASARNQTIANAVDGFVRPAYRNLATETERLVPTLDKLCKSGDASALEAARAAFTNAALAWSEVEIIRLGPVTEQNRLDRILHWPDRKGIGLKQVQAALAQKDLTAIDAERLAQKSVAMQGFGALEFLLFGTGSDDVAAWRETFRCHYAQAVADNISSMSSDISKEWDAPEGFAKTWENPSPQNNLYRSDTEALTDLIEIFVQGIELVRDVRTNGFLGEKPEGDKAKQAIYWRSNGTALSLGANIEGLNKLFEASRMADLATGDNAYLGNSIGFEFGNAQNALAAVKGKPIDAVLRDPDQRQKLDYFRTVTSSLSELFGTRLSGALDLTAGFSSLDGD